MHFEYVEFTAMTEMSCNWCEIKTIETSHGRAVDRVCALCARNVRAWLRGPTGGTAEHRGSTLDDSISTINNCIEWCWMVMTMFSRPISSYRKWLTGISVEHLHCTVIRWPIASNGTFALRPVLCSHYNFYFIDRECFRPWLRKQPGESKCQVDADMHHSRLPIVQKCCTSTSIPKMFLK